MKKKIVIFFAVVLFFILFFYIKNSSDYKMSKEVGSKYLYITVDGEKRNIIKVKKDTVVDFSVSKDTKVTLSLLENATILTQWNMEYDGSYVKEISNETIKVPVSLFHKKEGVDHTRREIKIEGIESGTTIISLVYGDFSFDINLEIK